MKELTWFLLAWLIAGFVVVGEAKAHNCPQSVLDYFHQFNLPAPSKLCNDKTYPPPQTVTTDDPVTTEGPTEPPTEPQQAYPGGDPNGPPQGPTPNYGPPQVPPATDEPSQDQTRLPQGEYQIPNGRVVVGPQGVFIDLPRFHLQINF